MPRFQINDNGHTFVITAPDQASAMSAYGTFKGSAQVGGAASGAPGAPELRNPDDPRTFLALPGTQQPPGAPPVNTVPPTQTFGTSSADTLNPLPALSALGNTIASNIPIAGPYLKAAGENFDAALDNNVYRPLTGAKGTTTPQDVAKTNARDVAANPAVVPVGQAVGAVAPYMVAGEVPLLNQALGMAGPWAQRLAMTGLSQYAINTGDNLAHGQDPVTAAKNAVLPAAASVPFALLGPEGRAEGAYASAVSNLKNNGIELTAGQQKGSNALMQAESQLGGIAAQNFRDKQLSQLTQAGLKTAGVVADVGSPQVMDKAFTSIGQKFDTLSKMSNIKYDTTLANGLADPVSTYWTSTGTTVPIFKELQDQAKNAAAANGGVIPGTAYQDMVTKIGTASKANPAIASTLHDMKDALDDAVARGMSGQTLAAWQTLRQQYANLMTMTDALTKAGGAAKAGLVTPEALDTAVRSSMTKRQYARGVGDLNQLSRDAVIAMPRLANSGTTARGIAQGLLTGAGVSLMHSDPLQALGSVATGLAVPVAAGRALLSAPVRSLLADGSHIPQSVARGVLPIIAPTAPLPQIPQF